MRKTPVELIADRFARRLANGRLAVDLATGHPVAIEELSLQTLPEQREWARRCASLYGIRHPHLIRLIDYGAIGTAMRFEALAMPASSLRSCSRSAAAAALTAVVSFLHRCRLSAGSLSWSRVIDLHGCVAVMPDAPTGRALESDSAIAQERAALRSLLGSTHRTVERAPPLAGIVLQRRRAAEDVVAWMEDRKAGGLGSLALCGPRFAGTSTTLELLAREARLRGFVPVHSSVLRSTATGHRFERAALADLLAGRHVMLIHEEEDGWCRVPPDDLVRLLLQLGTSSDRSHVAVVSRRTPPRRGPYVELDPLPASSLRQMIGLEAVARAPSREWLSLAIRQSAGRPGRFIQCCDARRTGGRRSRVTSAVAHASAVAESSVPYTVDVSIPEAPACLHSAGESTASRQLRAREQVDQAVRLAERGRHAAAERLLLGTAAALFRREDHFYGGRAALALARLLIARGKPAGAAHWCEQAREGFDRAGALADAVEAVAWLGAARTDEGRLRDAEAALRAACLAAEQIQGDRTLLGPPLSLARCLFWQARFDEADQLAADALVAIASEKAAPSAPVDRAKSDATKVYVLAGRLRARIAIVRRDLVQAGALAAAAHDTARATADAQWLAMAHDTAARVRAACGDLAGLRAEIDAGLTCARLAHAPLLAVRLRITLVASLAGSRNLADARAAATRLARTRLASLPPLLAAQARLALASSGDKAAVAHRASVAAFVRSSGANALDSNSTGSPSPGHPTALVVEDVIAVLHICQDLDDERTALARVGATVRDRTRASSVVFVGVEPEAPVVLSALGPQPDRLTLATRAIETGLAIPPARVAGTTEAAAPIRYGGVTIGALVCRWIAEAPSNPAAAEALLTAAAAACAPCLRVALDRRARPAARTAAGEPGLIGVSEASENLRRAIQRAATAPFAVLIEGESGSGKELVARAIHRIGSRRDRQFCALNCAALTDDLIEAELFGHARGAFTGAMAERRGLFEEAHGGTLLLDEIGELSPRGQAKLLRAIQEGEIRRMGENFPRAIDVRILAATNRALGEEASAGRFRQDLLYRLDVIRVSVPPLRTRIEDVPALAAHFWAESTKRLGSHATLAPATVANLSRYDWPGNVRELQNVIAALAVGAPRRGSVGPSALPEALARGANRSGSATLEEARTEFEQRFVRVALARAGGHRGRAAGDLGLTRQGFSKLLARLGLTEPTAGEDATPADSTIHGRTR